MGLVHSPIFLRFQSYYDQKSDSHGICAQGGHNETYLFINQMSILVISSVLFLSMTRNLERVI